MIALYKGKSLLSRLIRFRTWSDYSHAAWLDEENGWVIDAWPPTVRHVPNLSTGHSPGTTVDIYSVDMTPGDRWGIVSFMVRQIGKKYDWRGILGFVMRRDATQRQDRWFCSELIAAAFDHIGKPLLLNIKPHRVYPGMLPLSPLLKYEKTVVTGASNEKDNVGPVLDAVRGAGC